MCTVEDNGQEVEKIIDHAKSSFIAFATMAASAASHDLKHFARFCRNIICVGRNYREHAAELGNVVPDRPLVFLKSTSSLLLEGQGKIKVPPGSSELHHEVELAIIIGKSGSKIDESQANEFIGGYALALDMTSRDFQNEAKKKGMPWTLAKSWDTFCPISSLIPPSTISDPQNVNLWLKVDNELRQDGNTKDMIFPIRKLISYISGVMSLNFGDIILTGTPSGVSAVTSGQILEAGIGSIVKMSFQVE